VVVVADRFDVEVFKLFSDVTPDFTILEEGIELNDFHILFFFKVKLMEVESYAVKSCEDYLA
jgi:hypothetical protein